MPEQTIANPAPPNPFEDLWRESLHYYQKRTGYSLLELPPPMSKLSKCASVHDLVHSLQDIDKDFAEFRSKNVKIWDCLQKIASIIDKTRDVGNEAVEVAVR